MNEIIAEIIDTIEELMISPELVLVGAGGYGEVYAHPVHPSFAIKRSKLKNVCREWSEEFKIQSKLQSTMGERIDSNLLSIVPTYAYFEKSGYCYILMDRICPLHGTPKNFSNLSGKTIQALFGAPFSLQLDSKRGVFVGRNVLRKYFDLDSSAEVLGKFLATLQYGFNYDGLDLEYIAGTVCGDPTPRIYVLDFGKVGSFDPNANPKTLIDTLRTAYDAVEYFPLEDVCSYNNCSIEEEAENARLYQIFEKNYLETADQYGYEDLARQMLESV